MKAFDATNLRCPLCARDFTLQGNSLVCSTGHCFDVSAKGYVNLLPHAHALKGYTARFFKARRSIMEAGAYDAVIEAVIVAIKDVGHSVNVLDAGCGEGHLAHVVTSKIDGRMYAFDYSKDAVALGARQHGDVTWFVGDVSNIAVRDASMDVVLSVFSPAHYREFARILKPGGAMVKVFPGPRHFEEIRTLVNVGPKEDGAETSSLAHFFEAADSVEQTRVTLTTSLDPCLIDDLMDMTPLLFDVEKTDAMRKRLSCITVDAVVAVGSVRNYRLQ